FDWLRRTYARVLDATLARRPMVYTIWIGLTLLALPMFMMSWKSKELAPIEDQGFTFCYVQGAADATIDQTAFYTDQLNHQMMSVPEGAQTFQITFPDS